MHELSLACDNKTVGDEEVLHLLKHRRSQCCIRVTAQRNDEHIFGAHR